MLIATNLCTEQLEAKEACGDWLINRRGLDSHPVQVLALVN
jgi:hypothetical protein